MTKLSIQEKLKYLRDLEGWIIDYLQNNPTNSGAYSKNGYPTSVPAYLRNGIIFWSTGWGWRLRKNWDKVLFDRSQELIDEFLAILPSKSRPTPVAGDGSACPLCGCKQTMPTGDGNVIGLCGHVWQAEKLATPEHR